MELTKIKEQLKKLIDETGNEDVLNEVRNILELASDESYVLTDVQKRELDLLQEQHSAGKVKTYAWEEVRQGLIEKLKK
jgi:hypothetical protein